MIQKLYLNEVQELRSGDRAVRKMKKEVLDLLEKQEVDSQEYEMIRDKLFRAASIGEELGFERGFKYAFRLFTECMQEL